MTESTTSRHLAARCWGGILLLGLFVSWVHADTIQVQGDSDSIQAAIDAAASGDTIVVGPGNYDIGEFIEIVDKSITLISDDGADSTILNGQDSGSILFIRGPLASNTLVEGFTFIDGRATRSREGGCVVIRESSPTIQHNRFENCRSDPENSSSSGGAIKISAGENAPNPGRPTIRNNRFLNNRSYSQGGAIHIFRASARIIENVFTGNVARGSLEPGGGGVKATRTEGDVVEIRGNLFEGNEASFAGGAISVFDGSADIIGNEITGNGRSRFGGGIHLETDDRDLVFQVIDNVIEDNFATNQINDPEVGPAFDSVSGGGIHMNFRASVGFTDSTAEIRGNIFRGNSAVDTRCTSDVGNSDCGRGGAIEFFSGPLAKQLFQNNLIEGNIADVNASGNFDKVQLVFTDNTVRNNQSIYVHPGVGCVAGGGDEPVHCVIERNYFLDNGYKDGGVGHPSINDTGAVYVLRNTARIINNVFAGNSGYHGMIFMRHRPENYPDAFSRIEHNTFYGNQTERNAFGSLRLEGNGSIQNNIFDGDAWALRIDDFVSDDSIIGFNNIVNFSERVGRINGINVNTVEDLNALDGSEGNTGLDAGFVDPASHDYRLQETSSLVQSVECLVGVDEDIEHNSRPFGSLCDVGAHEYFEDTTIFHDRFEG
ncbi:right-handed parallel beta-helix repeat-containing protein [Wenzhouxiangella sp. EGI_FJ10305]|uniref:right-handed parallel beta-helix repeat-containing protein n=1 Tax=Wenzhouxiangella sp. EGI_FJ10305 TaxID=3243768 RepID=UPI0035DA4A67